MGAEGQSDRMVSDMEVPMKHRCGIEFLHSEKVASTDIHQHLLNVYKDQTVNVSAVRQWVVHLSSSSSHADFSQCGTKGFGSPLVKMPSSWR